MPAPSSHATPTPTPTGAGHAPTGAGHRPPVSVILHGQRWPDASTVAALRARLHEALPGAEIIETREADTAAIGAAALMSAAAARAIGSILLFLEASMLPSVDGLRSLVAAAAADAHCVAKSSNPLPFPSPWSQGEGFIFLGVLPGSTYVYRIFVDRA